MAEGQSPENSPPAPPPPSPPSPPSSNDQQTTSPPPSDNQETTSPPPPSSPDLAPPPQQQQESPPPPSPDNSFDGSSLSPPPPLSDSSSSSQSQSPPPPSPSPPQHSDNNGNKGNNNENNNGNDGSNGDGGNKNTSHTPPPASKTSDHSSQSPPKSLAPPTSNGGSNSSSNDGLNIGAVIGLVAAAGLLFIVMILLCVCCFRKKKKKSKLDQMPYYGSNAYAAGKRNWQPMPSPPAPVSGGANVIHSGEMSSNFSSGPYAPSLPPPHPSVAMGFNNSTFTYEELAAATQGFSKDRLLGQGGFGYVHKGILPNGKEIAVKSLKAGSGQGEREFQAEVEIISRVHHRHLVSLVGYCSNEGGQRLLVYEFLPNDTLEFHLHGKSGTVMDWPTRIKIALGSAKGLAYLHEDCHPKIIHRDIKASNILLDHNFEAKVADFGLAKLSQDNYTHVSTRVMGTFGYLAPEYASSGKLTEKSDVFSFGVMLLELITGRRPVDLSGDMEDSLVDWARPLCMSAAQDGEYGELVDPFLENQYEPYEMARMVACAAAAVRHSGRRRPKMSQIVRTLEGDASLDDLDDSVKPRQSSSGGEGSSDYEMGTYGAEMRKFRKVTLDSRDYGASSEYGATSEYGLDPSSSSSEEMHIGGSTRKTTTTNRGI
ncbi:proline-rich receptor-like protein kinase PERK7 isoform X2 [Arabidopsis lyrata subsp. lyrata]|uniref:proline-rich receptor-like protein kinase PERK7 isoform X2 n=1 Tax=Arabidopsis lyrata subsp. lyrata TaxID=81972 RepID=UPI000A29AE47|nr:proline-rich receptor-like protein kinase PERK7 isoform X2 [Arabidopsis lyrata subsp. lyrata]|eukprot:XP_020870884.1 proline-rich receptor-like protein kinase PERK7 isoform X2 [Arabidopsis lyrata subsp. lyrata]